MKKSPLIEVLILNYNGEKIIKECIESVLKKTKYKKYNISVIDNGSTDSSRDIIKKFKKVNLIELPFNYGFSGGFNRGIKRRLSKNDAEYIMWMNNDIIITDEKWLDKLVEPMIKDSEIGMTCGPLITPTGHEQKGGWMTLRGLTMSYINVYEDNEDTEFDFAHGGATLVRREAFIKTQGFDEKFNPVTNEETDFSMRIKYQGYKIYFVGDVQLLHKHSITIKSFENLFTFYIVKRNMIRFRLLHYPLLWIFASVFLDYKSLISMFIRWRNGKLVYNKRWPSFLKQYFLAIWHNMLNLGEIINRRNMLKLTKK